MAQLGFKEYSVLKTMLENDTDNEYVSVCNYGEDYRVTGIDIQFVLHTDGDDVIIDSVDELIANVKQISKKDIF